MSGQPNFGVLLERFFTQRLMQQRRASAHTIASYRDTFKMLLQFVQKRLRKAPSALALDDIDAPLVMAFLDEMERASRHHCPHAQPAVDGCALILPLCGLRGADALGADPARSGDSGQAVHAYAGAIPQPTGGSTRCWPRRISEAGRVAVITHCCCWLCRPG